jgi:hypothetical protein
VGCGTKEPVKKLPQLGVIMMNNRLVFVLLLSIGFATSSGCTINDKARVNIVYDQVANFSEYRLSSDASSSTSTSGIYVQYRIEQISNTGQEAKTFVFNKHAVVAVAPDQTSNEEPYNDTILLGAKLPNNVTVQPGQTISNVGCIIKEVLTANPQPLANTGGLVDLIHQIDSSQPVSMKRAQDDSSTALVMNALPSPLQNLCGD